MFIGLRDAGVHLEVICPDDAPHRQKLVDAGIEVHSLQLSGRLDRAGTAEIRRRLIEGQFDILHAFNNKAVANGLRASKGLPVRFIAYRGIEANVSVFDPASWTTYLHPRVDKIICVADAIRHYLVNMKFLWWRFPSEKAITIYKGHELGWYQAPAVQRSELGLPEDAFVVGCTANERPRKGLPYLIDAAKLLPDDANIHFLCILPALKREGLPKAIIEGMVYGVTPIVTDSGGSPELIEHGKSGLIIPPGSSRAIADAISQLYADRDDCARMGEEARQRIQRDFHTSKTVEQTLSVYQELLLQK
jgi:glycosyltransferase involved in cell wall biosynthesis